MPEWVEFEWQEPAYPGLKRENFPTHEAFSKAVEDKYKSLPRKTQRVQVRERVPLEAVQEAIESRRNAPRGKMPSKMLWLYFVWADQGVKFHWSLDESGRSQPLREGGDDIDAM